MINAIEIKNFKSAEKLDLKFGRVNTFIGENGSGKSTILEALAFAVAAENDKLDTEFLENRGVRVTAPEFMRSQFQGEVANKPIEIKLFVGAEGGSRKYILDNKNKTFSEWEIRVNNALPDVGAFQSDAATNSKLFQSVSRLLSGFAELEDVLITSSADTLAIKHIEFLYLSVDQVLVVLVMSDNEIQNQILHTDEEYTSSQLQQLSKYLNENLGGMKLTQLISEEAKVSRKINEDVASLKDFAVYTPENKQLRNLKEEGSLRPVGVQGQGLFRLLRQIDKEQPDARIDIEYGLKFIGWYESMDLENEPELIEDELFIKDRFLSKPFTQRSANEGFLYVLFYISLIVSEATPKIFAIDNFDSALNPKLCTELMKYIYTLACKYDKQIFLTTHNPALLDGINLNDDQQKLFVVSRAKTGGQTRAKTITADKKPVDSEGESLRLSEAMLRGYLGGLPKGF